ncbi:CaiB/BaiF CoA transferase family protein [Acrocarpospora catenulata]|uniref:CaiB/BaiF CoA transferase family protein n=1 Tax=Acrocarpospora catenulata TaxID=2836182 RepID=UPI001BDA0448|nr:CoA transferase [Acrocarpospora catenulata]
MASPDDTRERPQPPRDAIPGPLAGLRVVELTGGIAGRYCSRLLAGYGADVIRVDPPPGHPPPEPEPLDLLVNADKRSVTLDMTTQTGRDLLSRLLATADIVVTDDAWPAATGPAPAIDAGATRPGAVITRISTFGPGGPYESWAGNDFVLTALGGWTATQGRTEQPTFIGGPYVSFLTGTHAAFGCVSAVLHAEATGAGQTVEVAALEVAATCLLYDHVAFAYTGNTRRRLGNILGAPWLVLPVSDGHVAIIGIREWAEFWTVILAGAEIPPDPSSATTAAERAALTEVLHRHVAHLKKREFFETAQLLGVISAEVLTPADVLASPQYAARDYFVTAEHPLAGTLRYPGPPSRMLATPWLRRPAPTPGRHTAEVLDSLTPQGVRA